MIKRNFLPIFLTVALCYQPTGHCFGITALLSFFLTNPVASAATLCVLGGLAGTGTGYMCAKNTIKLTSEEEKRIGKYQVIGAVTGAFAGGSMSYLWRNYGK